MSETFGELLDTSNHCLFAKISNKLNELKPYAYDNIYSTPRSIILLSANTLMGS